jgi:glutathione-independent formaldehyde dehydrogenase
VDVTRELWILTTTQEGRKSHAFQSRRSLSRARQSRSSEHRLSSVENAAGKEIDHGVIIKPITTNICGSDQHMVRGRTTAPAGLVLGHEITGEVIECGSGAEFISKGDLVSVPFNVACGRCRNCKERRTDVCLNVNPSRAGGAYGYVDLGGWIGGQAEYVMVPYADWNLLKFPDKDQALAKIRDLTCL